MNEKISQQSIKNYFKITNYTSHKELTLSKRVRKALDTMSNPMDDSVVLNEEASSVTPKKRVVKKRTKKVATSGAANEADDEVGFPRTRKKKVPETVVSGSLVIPDADMEMASTSRAGVPNAKIPNIPETNIPIPQREKDRAILESNKLKAIKLLKAKKK